MTKCISISDEAVFRLLHVVCDRCLYFLSSLVSTVTDEAPRQSPKGLHGLGFCLTSRRREPPGMLCTVWMRASRMRETPQKKKKEHLSNAWSNIPLRMNTERFFEIAARLKSILFYPHQRTMEVIREKKCLPFIITCENKRLSTADWHSPPVLSNWGYMGQFESTPAPADEKRTCVKLDAFTDAWKLLTIVVWSGNFSLQSCNIKNLQNRVR